MPGGAVGLSPPPVASPGTNLPGPPRVASPGLSVGGRTFSFVPRVGMRMFELGPGRKFRASTGPSGYLRLELRTPDTWSTQISPDLVSVATNALALAGAGEPPDGFRFTQDDRYVGLMDVKTMNPFAQRRLQGR